MSYIGIARVILSLLAVVVLVCFALVFNIWIGIIVAIIFYIISDFIIMWGENK